MTPAPNRRWFRFSLRTLFVVMTLACIWLGYQLNWIRQRRAVRTGSTVAWQHEFPTDKMFQKMPPPPKAPGMLWLFGEIGYYAVHVVFNAEEPLTAAQKAEVERVSRLYPEASNVWGSAWIQPTADLSPAR
jgi:hypothetical protein